MGFGDFAYVFAVLLVLFGVMYGLLYFVKKYMFSFTQKGNQPVNIQVLSTRALMPKKFVSVVKIQDKVYFLGISENSVNLIDKLEESDFEIKGPEIESGETPSFKELLKKNLGIK